MGGDECAQLVFDLGFVLGDGIVKHWGNWMSRVYFEVGGVVLGWFQVDFRPLEHF